MKEKNEGIGNNEKKIEITNNCKEMNGCKERREEKDNQRPNFLTPYERHTFPALIGHELMPLASQS